MATSFKKTNLRSVPSLGEKVTRDTLYWKNLKFPVTRKESAAVTSISFRPVKPYNYAVTSSVKVQVIGCFNDQPIKAFSRFQKTAYSGSFRGDGNLLVAGGDEGLVRLYDTNAKTLLRVFKGHAGATHVTKFLSDNLRVFSGSNDNTVKLWDIASESEVTTFSEHKDYVRCGAASQASKDIFVTGSYDHSVRLWDSRACGSVLTVHHGAPVESVVMFPSGGIFITAGGTVMKVWDALAGGRQLLSLSHHHKTITDMCFCSRYQRLVSASLDRHVKIYEVSTYQPVHSFDYPSAILSVGIAPDDSVIAVGMVDGLLSIRHRKQQGDNIERMTKRRRKEFYQKMFQMKTPAPKKGYHVVEDKGMERETKYDAFLKKFEYSKALDAALNCGLKGQHPEVTVSVFEELIRRAGLARAIAGREEQSLLPLLKFLQKNLINPQFTNTLIDVIRVLLNEYEDQIGHMPSADVLLVGLRRTMNEEVTYIKALMETMGTVDALFAASHSHGLTDDQTSSTVNSEQSAELANFQPSQSAQSEDKRQKPDAVS